MPATAESIALSGWRAAVQSVPARVCLGLLGLLAVEAVSSAGIRHSQKCLLAAERRLRDRPREWGRPDPTAAAARAYDLVWWVRSGARASPASGLPRFVLPLSGRGAASLVRDVRAGTVDTLIIGGTAMRVLAADPPRKADDAAVIVAALPTDALVYGGGLHAPAGMLPSQYEDGAAMPDAVAVHALGVRVGLVG